VALLAVVAVAAAAPVVVLVAAVAAVALLWHGQLSIHPVVETDSRVRRVAVAAVAVDLMELAVPDSPTLAVLVALLLLGLTDRLTAVAVAAVTVREVTLLPAVAAALVLAVLLVTAVLRDKQPLLVQVVAVAAGEVLTRRVNSVVTVQEAHF
jgi:hypothetical protein